MKLLLYCTKAKPYLYRRDDDNFELSNKLNSEDINDYKKYYGLNNGKIVAECDFEVEKIHKFYCCGFIVNTNTMCYRELLGKSCLSDEEISNYSPNYAIHIKNLHIFDEPKELNDYYSQNQVDFIEESELWRLKKGVSKAPQNMQKVYKYSFKDCKLNKYILISIKPEWLCKILNGEKTIECRKRILKEMMSK